MKRKIFLLLLSISFFTQALNSQSLADKLIQLQNEYNFNFDTLDAGNQFKEKYVLYFTQALDYQGGSQKTFRQRVFIAHRNFEAPVIFVTEGYDANRTEKKDYQTELAALFSANEVTVEHRYFSKSVPDSLEWEFLTVENAAMDHHRIMQMVRDLYSGKVVCTGISKGGQTANYYSYLFPNDADIYVPYVAPLNFSSEDRRVYSFLEQVGDSKCRERILAFQRHLLENKSELLPAFITLAREKKLHYSMGYEKAFELLVFEYSFAFWQWGYFKCKDIPLKSKKPAKLLSHLDRVAGFDWISQEGINRLQPFFYQAMRETGMYGYNIAEFKDLCSFSSNPTFEFSLPKGVSVNFEEELMQRVDFYIRHKAKNSIFIYGEYDPWSATAVELAGHTNSFKIVKPGGSHRTRISNLPEVQKQMVLDSLKTWLSRPSKYQPDFQNNTNKKVTGIGGIFFKSKDPSKLRLWYATNLGLMTNDYGSLFEFRESDNPEQKAYLQWSPFSEKTNYFQPSEKEFMINYRVENIEKLVVELRANGVQVLDQIESYEYGKFVHILDPENNKIELWEPVDSVFTKLYEGKTTK